MEKKVLTAREVRERKILRLAPLVVVPLLTLLFGVGGGGRGREVMVTAAGFLKSLPGAIVAPVTRLNKMGYYDLAKRDSVAARQRMVIQANYARQMGFGEADSNVRRVRERLEVLKSVVGGAGSSVSAGRAADGIGHLVAGAPVSAGRVVGAITAGGFAAAGRSASGVAAAAGHSATGFAPPAVRGIVERPAEVARAGQLGRLEPSRPAAGLERLEQLVRVLQRDEGGSAEVRELSGVVERLVALQRGQGDTGRKMVPERVVPVMRPVMIVQALPEEKEDTVGGFDSSRIEAMVPVETVLVSGGELRLELVRDVLIGRQRVPAGTPLYGTVSLSGERLRVVIGAIAAQGRVLPVNLEVEDEDGMAGIYIPGAPVSEALRESAGQELGSLGSGVVSTSLAGQAAGAGIVLARSLMGKRIRPVKVTIPAGYKVLLHVKNSGL